MECNAMKVIDEFIEGCKGDPIELRRTRELFGMVQDISRFDDEIKRLFRLKRIATERAESIVFSFRLTSFLRKNIGLIDGERSRLTWDRVLEVLEVDGEMTNRQIADALRAEVGLTSQLLRAMHEAGEVSRRSENRPSLRHFYSITGTKQNGNH